MCSVWKCRALEAQAKLAEVEKKIARLESELSGTDRILARNTD